MKNRNLNAETQRRGVERPILMRGEMVRAIRAAEKTHTRRMVDGLLSRAEMAPEDYESLSRCCITRESTLELREGVLGQILTAEDIAKVDWMPGEERAAGWGPIVGGKGPGGRGIPMRCPYGEVGDFLWVKESWRVASNWDDVKPSEIEVCRDEVRYLADGDVDLSGRDRVSIFMPRAFSRLLLRVVKVRVERLIDISEADAIAEGVRAGQYFSGAVEEPITAVLAYRDLWESINGLGSWKLNPWVWVIEFDPQIARMDADSKAGNFNAEAAEMQRGNAKG